MSFGRGKTHFDLSHMLVSVNSHKIHCRGTWNVQIPLYDCQEEDDAELNAEFKLEDLVYNWLEDMIQEEMGIDLEIQKLCIVWRMSNSGQLGRVYDNCSLRGAVLDHFISRKNVVQLYIVSNDDITNLPEYYPA